jgi:hypothetical protein
MGWCSYKMGSAKLAWQPFLKEVMRCGVTCPMIQRYFRLEIDKPLETDLQPIVYKHLPWTLPDRQGMGVNDEGSASEPKLGCATGI